MSEASVRRVAVVGTGVIGASWATWFLARGLDVVATDSAPGAEARLREAVAAQWPSMERLGLAPGASPDRLRFEASLERAVAESEFVQENGPEDLEIKRALFHRLDDAAPAEAILASSSSTLLMSDVQSACAHPERVALGHPFNPPHLIPLVEVVGGRDTSETVVERTMAFYRGVGKHPIRLRKEIRGHVANRLQAALWREALHLVQAGVASVADVDAAIAHGPGLRWALLGPFVNLHLSGGEGGIKELFGKPLWRATQAMMRDLGDVSFSAVLDAEVADGVQEELAAFDVSDVVRCRDDLLLHLLRLKAEAGRLP